jgi:hypothetical protein
LPARARSAATLDSTTTVPCPCAPRRPRHSTSSEPLSTNISPYTVQQPQLAIVERVTIAFLRRYLNGVRGASRRIVAGGNVRGASTIQAVL